jgi:siroheme synthase (precorrin-2 oxidase/ferrochelatase)
MAPHSEHSPDFSGLDAPLTIDIPVLIVGGGPTGLLEAHMLAKLGGSSLSYSPEFRFQELNFKSEISCY